MTTLTRRRAAAADSALARSELRAAAAVFALVAAGHALGSMVVYQFDHTPSSGVSFFPADGVTVAAFLLSPTRRWPVVALATFAAEDVSHLVLHESVLTGAGLALSNTIGPLIGAWVALHLLGHVPQLEDPRDLWVLIGGGVLLGPLVDTLTGPPFARLTVQTSPYLETAARWWTGDALGAFIVGLLILAWAQPVRWPRPDGTLVGEAAACAVVLAAVAYATFFVFADPLAYLVLLPVGWAALRFGMRGATAAVAGVTVIAEWATVTGHGPFAAGAPAAVRSALWLLQLFLAVTAIAAVAVASEVAQTRRAEAARRASELAEHRAELAVEQAATVERGRLARELHDSVSQALFATALHARSAEKQLARRGIVEPKLAADIGALRELTAAALAEMRALIFELRPEALVAEGLVAALERYGAAVQARTGLTVTVTGPPDRLSLTPDVEEHLYRVTLEAINNAVKHAAATRLHVTVADLGDAIEAVVTDDGVGYNPTRATPGHIGLHTMRERATAAGGTLEVAGRTSIGTTVRCTMPTC